MTHHMAVASRYAINPAEIYRPSQNVRGKTFREAVESYEEHVRRNPLLDPIVRWLGDTVLDEIVPFDLVQIAKGIPGIKNATKNRHFLTPIRSVLNHAWQRRWCSYIKIPSLKEEAPKEKEPATPLWLYLFFRQCELEGAHHLAALVMFMSQTGARVSEAIRVEWRDLDRANRTAILLKTKTDTNSVRHLTDDLVAKLYELESRPRGRNPDRVFRYKCRWSVNDRIRRICKSAGIPYKPSHSCGRVTYATLALSLGVDIPTAMKGGGWKSMTVFSRYAKPGKDAGRRVAARFNEMHHDVHV